MRIVQLNMIYPEVISSATDSNITLRSAMTYEVHTSLRIFYCLQKLSNTTRQTTLIASLPLRHSEVKYQGEAIPILCAMGAHELRPDVKFSNFLALSIQISNAVSQTLDSKKIGLPKV